MRDVKDVNPAIDLSKPKVHRIWVAFDLSGFPSSITRNLFSTPKSRWRLQVIDDIVGNHFLKLLLIQIPI
jgi:hypothetical protein